MSLRETSFRGNLVYWKKIAAEKILNVRILLAILTFAGFSAVFSWQAALAIMACVGIHEYGHLWVANKMGIPTKGFVFIPFAGGIAFIQGEPRTQSDQIVLALMGPLWGMGISIVAMVLYSFTGNPVWAAIGAANAAGNLANFIPAYPLDGGRVMSAFLLSLPKGNGFFWLILISGFFTFLAALKGFWPFALVGLYGLRETIIRAKREKAHYAAVQELEKLTNQWTEQSRNLTATVGDNEESIQQRSQKQKDFSDRSTSTEQETNEYYEAIKPLDFLRLKRVPNGRNAEEVLKYLILRENLVSGLATDVPMKAAVHYKIMADLARESVVHFHELKENNLSDNQVILGASCYVILGALFFLVFTTLAAVDGAIDILTFR